MHNRWVIGVVFALVACEHGKGGGPAGSSGLDQAQPLGSLEPAEVAQLCGYLVSIAPEPRTITCPDGSTSSIDQTSEADCEMALVEQDMQLDDCGITVGEYETCVEALAEVTDQEVCSQTFPAECDPLLACLGVTPTDPPQPGG